MSRYAREYSEPARNLHPLVSALRKRRYDIGMTARELAKKSGYTMHQIQDWERGRYVPGIRPIMDLAQSLGVRIEVVED